MIGPRHKRVLDFESLDACGDPARGLMLSHASQLDLAKSGFKSALHLTAAINKAADAAIAHHKAGRQ